MAEILPASVQLYSCIQLKRILRIKRIEKSLPEFFFFELLILFYHRLSEFITAGMD